MRLSLREAMEKSDAFAGRHHWSDAKLFQETRTFIEKFGFKNPTDFETCALMLLMNPAKGINNDKKKDQPARILLQSTLGEEGMMIFRDIFSNNNRKLIEKFFKNDIIRRLWT